MFKKVKLFNLILTLMIALLLVNMFEVSAISGNTTLTLNGINVTVTESNADPIVVKGGEASAGLVIVEFNHNISSNNNVLLLSLQLLHF